MHRLIAGILSAALALAPASAGQMSLLGAGKASGAAPAYTGPGDVVASAKIWHGLRCYNTAYTGNVADVYAPSDASHTLITCSSGGVLNETLQALSTTCATSCTVKTLYDQSGALSCGGSACDLVQATEASRPTLVISGINSKLTIALSGSQRMLTGAGVTSFNQPYTFSVAFKRTSATVGIIYGTNGGNGAAVAGWSGTNQFATTAGAFVQVNSITDNVAHSAQVIANGSSSASSTYIDGSTTALGNTSGSDPMFGTLYLGDDGFGDFWAGQFTEAGVWNSAFNGTQLTNMCNNQKTYYALGGSC